MKTKINCAYGSTMPTTAEPTAAAVEYGCDACEYIYNNKIIRCSKFVFISGKNPQNNDQYQDVAKCADAWQPILQLENSATNRAQTAAIESFRNEMVKSNHNLLQRSKHKIIELEPGQ